MAVLEISPLTNERVITNKRSEVRNLLYNCMWLMQREAKTTSSALFSNTVWYILENLVNLLI